MSEQSCKGCESERKRRQDETAFFGFLSVLIFVWTVGYFMGAYL
jgi:hypothetical protein